MNLFYIALPLSLSAMPLYLIYRLKRRHKKLMKQIESFNGNNSYYHCLYFEPKESCEDHLLNNTACGERCAQHYIMTIRKFISSAKYSISLCMYHYTLKQITTDLIKAHKRGVIIRNISDQVTSAINHSQINYLYKKFGITAKIPSVPNSFMHHKFCLIDANHDELAKMFLGSLNLTSQGITNNFEFLLMTNNKQLIKEYSKEFEILWENFKTAYSE